jgi:hypothetical protein
MPIVNPCTTGNDFGSSPSVCHVESPSVSSGVGFTTSTQNPATSAFLSVVNDVNGVAQYSPPSSTSGPQTVTVEAKGNIWFTESDSRVNRIARVQISSPSFPACGLLCQIHQEGGYRDCPASLVSEVMRKTLMRSFVCGSNCAHACSTCHVDLGRGSW